MNNINFFLLSGDDNIISYIDNLLKSDKQFNFDGYTNSLDSSLNWFNKRNIQKNSENILFIDDYAFSKSKIINFLDDTNRPNLRHKRVIYTQSFDSSYISSLNRPNVCGIFHRQETILLKQQVKKNKGISDQRNIKFINTLKLISQGTICYDDIISNMLIRRYAWAKGDYESELIQEKTSKIERQNIPGISGFNSGKIVGQIKNLTHREKELLLLIAQGKQNKAISNELNISVGTVEQHKDHIIKKLKLKSTTELIIFSVRVEVVIENLLSSSNK